MKKIIQSIWLRIRFLFLSLFKYDTDCDSIRYFNTSHLRLTVDNQKVRPKIPANFWELKVPYHYHCVETFGFKYPFSITVKPRIINHHYKNLSRKAEYLCDIAYFSKATLLQGKHLFQLAVQGMKANTVGEIRIKASPYKSLFSFYIYKHDNGDVSVEVKTFGEGGIKEVIYESGAIDFRVGWTYLYDKLVFQVNCTPLLSIPYTYPSDKSVDVVISHYPSEEYKKNLSGINSTFTITEVAHY